MKNTKRILFVFGTRPEAIKLAPLIIELKKDSSFEIKICLTSQHKQMLGQVIEFFQLKEDFNLNIMKQNQDLYDVTINTLKGLRGVFKKYKPDMIIVQGDTTSAFIAALAAFYEKISIAHIEAGLRTFNKYLPYPEEINRSLITAVADIHFAPTQKAEQNLIHEGIEKNRILVTGNTGIDALFYTSNKIKKTIPSFFKRINIKNRNAKIITITGHRRESFGKPFENLCKAIKDIAIKHPEVTLIYPVHLNPNVQKPVYSILKKISNVYLIEPLNYPDFVWLLNRSYLVLTDSGGIQEEAPSIGKPVIVMREVTERPEGVREGVVKLVGTDREKIVRTVNKLLSDTKLYKKMSTPCLVYGDGKASKRIRQFLKDFETI
jgi:UDP-N-acetylglucosamine 2-epimerase (non-hydrolysing)